MELKLKGFKPHLTTFVWKRFSASKTFTPSQNTPLGSTTYRWRIAPRRNQAKSQNWSRFESSKSQKLRLTQRSPGDNDQIYSAQYRHLRPGLGRWLKRDPIGFGGGQNNLYGYVGNRPMFGVDPSGLRILVVGGGSSFANYFSEPFIPEQQTAGKFVEDLRNYWGSGSSFIKDAGAIVPLGFNDSSGQSFGVSTASECEPLIIVGFSGGADLIRRMTPSWRTQAGRDIDLEVLIDPVYSLFPLVGNFARPVGVKSVVNLLQDSAPDVAGVNIPIFSGYELVGLNGTTDKQKNANSAFGLNPTAGHFDLPFNPVVQNYIFREIENVVLESLRGP